MRKLALLFGKKELNNYMDNGFQSLLKSLKSKISKKGIPLNKKVELAISDAAKAELKRAVGKGSVRKYLSIKL